MVTGGAGWLLLRNGMPHTLALSIALALGAVVALALLLLVIRPLQRAQNTSAVETQSLLGCTAKVVEKIPAGGYGKISLVLPDHGNTHNAPAKSHYGGEIPARTMVEVTRIEKNTYYVRPVPVEADAFM